MLASKSPWNQHSREGVAGGWFPRRGDDPPTTKTQPPSTLPDALSTCRILKQRLGGAPPAAGDGQLTHNSLGPAKTKMCPALRGRETDLFVPRPGQQGWGGGSQGAEPAPPRQKGQCVQKAWGGVPEDPRGSHRPARGKNGCGGRQLSGICPERWGIFLVYGVVCLCLEWSPLWLLHDKLQGSGGGVGRAAYISQDGYNHPMPTGPPESPPATHTPRRHPV